MARLTADTWESVRAEREAGSTFDSLAAKYGVSKTAIIKRSKSEGWGDGKDLGAAIRRKVTEKVAGAVTPGNPKKRAEAIDAAASRAAAVVERHKADWEEHRTKFGVVAENFEECKHAKISAEMITIRQRSERAAYGLDDVSTQPTIVIERSYGR